MTTIVDWQKVDGEKAAEFLRGVGEKMTGSEGELVLDFSAVQRLSPAGLLAFEELAAMAEGKSVKLAVRGVNVTVYKVLKLARLASRCSSVD